MFIVRNLFGLSSPEPEKKADIAPKGTSGQLVPKPQTLAADENKTSQKALQDKSILNLGGREPLPMKLCESAIQFMETIKEIPFPPNRVFLYDPKNEANQKFLFLNALTVIQDPQSKSIVINADVAGGEKSMIYKQCENIFMHSQSIHSGKIAMPLHSKAIIAPQKFADAAVQFFTDEDRLDQLEDRNIKIELHGDGEASQAWEAAINKLPKKVKERAKELFIIAEPLTIQNSKANWIVCPVRGDGERLTNENLEKSGPTAKTILRAFVSAQPADDSANASTVSAASAASSSAAVASVAADILPPVPAFARGAGLPSSVASTKSIPASQLTLKQARAAIDGGPSLTPSDSNLIPSTFAITTPYPQQVARHEAAKDFLSKVIPGLGGTVSFVSAGTPRPYVDHATINIDPTQLDDDLFRFEWTGDDGVQANIIEAGQINDGKIRIYVAASQFNAAEASSTYTHRKETCIQGYLGDRTQGPQAQLAYSADQIRAIAVGANFPYNGLCRVLDGETIKTAADGYFRPTASTAEKLVNQLKEKGHLMEFPLIGNNPRTKMARKISDFNDDSRGSQRVYMMLTAAPAIGYMREAIPQAASQEIQFLAALNRFRAEFKAAIDLAKSTKQPVELKMAEVGCGVFGNEDLIVAKAFYQSALECKKELRENHITVQLQSYGTNQRPKTAIVKELGLQDVRQGEKVIQQEFEKKEELESAAAASSSSAASPPPSAASKPAAVASVDIPGAQEFNTQSSAWEKSGISRLKEDKFIEGEKDVRWTSSIKLLLFMSDSESKLKFEFPEENSFISFKKPGEGSLSVFVSNDKGGPPLYELRIDKEGKISKFSNKDSGIPKEITGNDVRILSKCASTLTSGRRMQDF